MATRMQQRRGTAAQWISTNTGNGPILNAGEIGYETDTNKFKIGDGTNHWVNLDYFIDASSTVNPAFGSSITFEGATADAYETTLVVTDPTADRTITLPNATGTVVLADGSGNVTVSGDLTVSGTTTTINSTTINATTGIVFEGATADAFETTVTVTDPTADRTITFQDATGTVALTSDITVTASSTNTLSNKSISLASNTVTSTLAQLNTAVSDADVASLAGTETLTNKTLTSPVINTPTGITKSDVGLANVDNTTDANKPVSSATQTALDLKLASATAATTYAPLAAPALTGNATAVNLTISGDLTVNGTTTNINSTSLVVEDKNIVLGDAATPTDTTADGGGITLKGLTDKTFNWVDATDSWTSSEHINLASGKTLKYNGTDLVAAQSGNSGKYLTTDGTSTSWGTISGYSAPTLGSTSIASGATVTTINGLTLGNPSLSVSTQVNRFVAIAKYAAVSGYSTDGITWSTAAMPSNDPWVDVTYGNNTFFATNGFGTASATSADGGATWTARSLPDYNDGGWYQAVYGDKFVAVGKNMSGTGKAATSTDAITWTLRTLPGSYDWVLVTYGNGKYVALADGSNAAAHSTDGITWTATTLSVNQSYQGITYGDKFVAVGQNFGTGINTSVSYSTNGVTWTSATIPDALWKDVTYGNGKYVAVSGGGQSSTVAASSTDGITWTARTLPADKPWTSVTYGNGKFTAVAQSYGTPSDAFATSTDGITWTTQAAPSDNSYWSVTHGNPTLVSSGVLTVGGSTGTSGQVLSSTGSGVQWITPAAGADEMLTLMGAY
jgi:hypothetical protein